MNYDKTFGEVTNALDILAEREKESFNFTHAIWQKTTWHERQIQELKEKQLGCFSPYAYAERIRGLQTELNDFRSRMDRIKNETPMLFIAIFNLNGFIKAEVSTGNIYHNCFRMPLPSKLKLFSEQEEITALLNYMQFRIVKQKILFSDKGNTKVSYYEEI